MIKQTESIIKLYNKSLNDLVLLMKDDFNNQNLYKAIIELKQEKIGTGFYPHTCPHFIEGMRLLDEEIEKNNLDAIRIKIYVNEGHTVCENPNFEGVKELYKKLYILTNDEEIVSFLTDFDSYIGKCMLKHLDNLYYRRCDIVNNRSGKITGSVDPDTHYDYLKYSSSNKDE